MCDFCFCCHVKRRRNKTSLALCTWSVAQELTDWFDKTAALKNKEAFCCLYMEIYYLVMEITEVKEPDPVSMENKKFLCETWGNSIPLLFF